MLMLDYVLPEAQHSQRIDLKPWAAALDSEI